MIAQRKTKHDKGFADFRWKFAEFFNLGPRERLKTGLWRRNRYAGAHLAPAPHAPLGPRVIPFLLRMPHRIDPATLAVRDDGALFSPVYGDVYHSVSGALAQADYVFIRGNGLPARWQRRRRFTIVETGFGAGANFLATWQAWRADPARCERLHFVSVEKHPFTRDDIRLVTTKSRTRAAPTLAIPKSRRSRSSWPTHGRNYCPACIGSNSTTAALR
jgi:tRNA 5-methylaminomethyl-2-thiouridine biosynthesis bifunctional protein